MNDAQGNAFDTMWTYVVGTNFDLLFGDVPGGSEFVCSTIMGINTEGLFSGAVRENAGKLGKNIVTSYTERQTDPKRFEKEESLFKEWCVAFTLVYRTLSHHTRQVRHLGWERLG